MELHCPRSFGDVAHLSAAASDAHWSESEARTRERGEDGELSCSIGTRFCLSDTWAVSWNKNQLIHFNIIVFVFLQNGETERDWEGD